MNANEIDLVAIKDASILLTDAQHAYQDPKWMMMVGKVIERLDEQIKVIEAAQAKEVLR